MATVDEPAIEILDVTDRHAYERIPPCADPGFDHRSCDYWEDADRGSKAIRLEWIDPQAVPSDRTVGAPERTVANPFAPVAEPMANPFARGESGLADNPFLTGLDPADNPFAPRRPEARSVGDGAPPKLRLLSRGLAVAGSYAKVLLLDGTPAAYCQFGPLTAYPRAQRTRDLYPALPDAPLPAVITCISTTAAARGAGLARRLVDEVCADLDGRGFAAVEAYPDVGARLDATSAATPGFWISVGFHVAAADERFPVLRRDLA